MIARSRVGMPPILGTQAGSLGCAEAPEKTQVLRFSRLLPSVQRRATFLGFELFWFIDREGIPRVKRRTARKRLQGAIRRVKEWIKSHRHLPGREFIQGLNRRLVGHYNDYGLRGNSADLWRFYNAGVASAFKWLNRRGVSARALHGRPSLVPAKSSVSPNPASPSRAACNMNWCLHETSRSRESEYYRGTGCGKTARPGLWRGLRATGVPTPKASLLPCLEILGKILVCTLFPRLIVLPQLE
jgi:hypothetical protein